MTDLPSTGEPPPPADLPSATELQARLAAERTGTPFLLDRAGPGGGQRIHPLPGDAVGPVSIGRGEQCAIRLTADTEASRLHAVLERLGGDWVLADDGLSRNGTYVNDERLAIRRRLHHGDVIRCGRTRLLFVAPAERAEQRTASAEHGAPAALTDTQRRLLVALCRPLLCADPFALPASNREIAAELHLSVGGVKAHLRTLFAKLGVADELGHNHKRLRLAERAVETGAVSVRELRGDR